MSKASFVVYIDESGDEGFNFARGSSEWFVVAAVIARKVNELEMMKVVDEIRVTIQKPTGHHLHFRDLRHDHRLATVGAIAARRLRWIAVAVHKPSLRELTGERLYFYACRLLLERVARCCAEHTREGEGDGSADVVFSNKSSMSYDDFRAYLEKLHRDDPPISKRIIPPGQVKARGARTMRGLQVADAVASSVWYALTRRSGYTEPRYVCMLQPICHSVGARHDGIGLKIFPKISALSAEAVAVLEWAYESFGFRK